MRFFLTILFLVPVILLAQNRKKAERAYDKAVDFYQKNEDKKAESFAQQSLRQDSSFLKPYLLLGQLFEDTRKYNESIQYYLKGLSDNNSKNAWGYWKVGVLQFRQGNYSQAKQNLEYFLSFENQSERYIKSSYQLLDNCNFAIESLKKPVFFQPENLGLGVNSKWEEYLPSISADGMLLVFTRRGPHIDNIVSEDFYCSFYNEGKWTESENLGQDLNTYGNEGAQCLSSDGSILFFTACDREDGYGRCDIYVSFLGVNGWGKANNIGPSINSPYWESQPSISSDGKELYFVSNRPGGKGGMDIWKSTLTPQGDFGTPINLGSVINTMNDEMSPFIHMDNQTLYFASKGHIGMGDFDLFVSRRINYKNKWSSPKNLGYPINTHDVENSLIVSSDGKKAYFVSDKSGYGKEDIFWFDLPNELQPNKVEGLELDIITNKKGSEIILKNVNFEHNSFELNEICFNNLNNLIDYLNKYPEVNIVIEGHTDNVGDAKDNLLLSTNRAKSVYYYLVDALIEPGRLSYVGYGEDMPLVSNDSESGRAQNRRTSFRIK